jgi:hypothetical protein
VSIAAAVDELARAISAVTPAADDKLQWSIKVTKKTADEVWAERKTAKGGFTDNLTFKVGQREGSQIEATSVR